MSKFWNFKNVQNSTAELQLYGPISEYSWWGDEITPKQFAEDLKALGNVKTINVRINSGGGDVFAGQTIYALLKSHPATVNVYIDGLAASIASIIAMAADNLIMHAGSMIMIHNPWSGAWGEASDFRHMAEVLDKIRDSLVAVYKNKTGKTEEEIRAWMDAETWFTAEEAKALGFADTVLKDVKIAASIKGRNLVMNGVSFDLAQYKKQITIGEKGVQDMAGIQSRQEALEQVKAIYKAEEEEKEKKEKENMTEEEKEKKDKEMEEEEEKENMTEEEEEKENMTEEEEEEKENMTEEEEEKENMTEEEKEKENMTEEEEEKDEEMEEEEEKEKTSKNKAKKKVNKVVNGVSAEIKALINDANRKAEAAMAELQKIRDERELETFVAKAKTFNNLSMNAEEYGKIFMNFARADKKGFEKLEALLKSANNAVEKGALFSIKGSNQAGDAGAGDAWSIMDKRANKLVAEKKAASYADALTEVMKNDPELYNRYIAEMQK